MQKSKIKITNYDVFENGRIKLSSILRYMQELACEDSDACGATYELLRSHNMVFVITKLALEFHGDIYDGDEIELSTCSHSIQGVTFVRRFVATKGDETVMTAVTDWVLMNFETRHVLRPAAIPIPFPEEHMLEAPIEVKRRIELPDTTEYAVHRVRYTELDENRHLNNTVYADIMIDNLPLPIPDKRIDRCCINFNGEACYGDELHVSCELRDGVYLSAAENVTGGKQCYTAELTFAGGNNA